MGGLLDLEKAYDKTDQDFTDLFQPRVSDPSGGSGFMAAFVRVIPRY